MRYFNRREMPPPEILLSSDVEARRREIDDYIASVKHKGGQRRPPLCQDILESAELVYHVRQSFLNVCAYCESATEKRGQVFHHRPPGLAEQSNGETELLNYVWLTYEWENLYWVCEDCVRRKANRFYANTPTQEPKGDIESLRQTEGELLLDPCFHELHNNLEFAPNGQVTGLRERGKSTIDLLDLNSIDLRVARRNTSHKLVALLRHKYRVVPIPTGLSTGMADAILAEHKPGGGTAQLLPHIGAATLALLHWFRQRDIGIVDCASLVHVLNDALAQPEVEKLLDDYEQAIGEQAESAELLDKAFKVHSDAPTPGSSDRIFRLADTALLDARIRKIVIRNFKALKGVELTLPPHVSDPKIEVPCAMILGENATGKSSVLEAIALALLGKRETNLLVDFLKPAFNDISPGEMVHRPDPKNWDIRTQKEMQIEISYFGPELTSDLSAFAHDPVYEGDLSPSKIVVAYGPRRFFSKKNTDYQPEPMFRVQSMFDPLCTLPNPGDWLTGLSKKEFDAVVRALREVLMLDPDADVFPEKDNPDTKRIMIETAQGLTPLDSLSEGYKSVVAMATDIARALLAHYDNLEFAHAVVLIDEIETHLHPRWKMQIVQRLRRAFPRVQFIITTHDPLCLRGMHAGEVFVLQRDPENQRVETLSDLPDVRGMRAEQILTSEFFGLGSTDPETDAKLMRYQNLAAKVDRTEAETHEKARLQGEIKQTMKVGDTIQEQLFNEAFSQAGIDPLAPMGKITDTSRRKMVADLLAAIRAKELHFDRPEAGMQADP